MPIYEYECTACQQRLEVRQSIHDEALTVCPHCGAPLKRLFSSVGIVFKGSGFYKTDSRPGASTGPASSGSTESTAPAPTSSTATGSGPVPASSASSPSTPAASSAD